MGNDGAHTIEQTLYQSRPNAVGSDLFCDRRIRRAVNFSAFRRNGNKLAPVLKRDQLIEGQVAQRTHLRSDFWAVAAAKLEVHHKALIDRMLTKLIALGLTVALLKCNLPRCWDRLVKRPVGRAAIAISSPRDPCQVLPESWQ
jgi:hypothetical protein